MGKICEKLFGHVTQPYFKLPGTKVEFVELLLNFGVIHTFGISRALCPWVMKKMHARINASKGNRWFGIAVSVLYCSKPPSNKRTPINTFWLCCLEFQSQCPTSR